MANLRTPEQLLAVRRQTDSCSLADAIEALIAQNTLLTSRQTMRLLGVSDATFWRMIERGDFPRGVKITSNRYGWPLGETMAWLDSKKAER